jgi:hypothetical protein
VNIGKNKYTYMHTYIRTYIHTYIHKYTHTYIHTYMLTYIPMYQKEISAFVNAIDFDAFTTKSSTDLILNEQ